MRKILVRIFNLIYLALAALAIIVTYTKPLIDIDASISVPKDQLTTLVYDSISDKITEQDWNDALASIEGDNITADLKLSIPSDTLVKRDSAGTTKKITDSICGTAENIINMVKPVVATLVNVVIREIAQDALHDAIASEIAANGVTEEMRNDPDAAMAMVGIDDEFILEFTTQICDKIIGRNGEETVATLDDLMETINEMNHTICSKLLEGTILNNAIVIDAYCESMNADVRAQLVNNFQKTTIATEIPGSDPKNYEIITFNKILNRFIIAVLNKINGDDSDLENIMSFGAGSSEEQPLTKLTLHDEQPPQAGATNEEVNAKIEEVVSSKLTSLTDILEQYSLFPMILVLVLMAPWALFALITIIRTIRKKCWTKPWVVFVFAFLQLIFGLGLYLLTAKLLPTIVGLIPNETIGSILGASSFVITTSSLIPSIIYVAFIPLTIIYAIIAHKVKKDWKQGKKDRKAA